MTTKTINLYSFDELTKEQQEKVIENHRDINTFDNWHDWEIEEWTQKLSRQGFNDAKIYFSGFYSQGDGASFSANVDLSKFLKGRRLATKYAKEMKLAEETGDNIVIEQSSPHYCHEYTMSIDSDNLPADLENFILEEARKQACAIYKDLRSLYEDLTSNETIAETLRANEYLFNEETLKIDSE